MAVATGQPLAGGSLASRAGPEPGEEAGRESECFAIQGGAVSGITPSRYADPTEMNLSST